MDRRALNINQPITGMNRQSFPTQKDENAYNFQNNGNLETDELGGVALTNEHSNILCSRFKPGYKVIGNKVDFSANEIIFFLTHPDTGISEIGVLKFDNLVSLDDDQVDTLECNCNFHELLEGPLEEKIQEEYCKYETLINDECNKCLNFSIYHPIKSIVIKDKKGKKTVTFTDGINSPRYFDRNNIEQYKSKGNIVCNDDSDVEETCLDCDKLGVFLDYNIPIITAEVLQVGGNLKMGVYEATIAYSDSLGNELSEYLTTTGEVPIFDQNNLILEQPDLASPTNYSIKFKVHNLDKRFTHYKCVIKQRADINGNTSYIDLGVFPITNDIITYANDSDYPNSNAQAVNMQKPKYKTLGNVMTSNGYLFGYDYEVENEWNLQPIANLLGSFLQWQSIQAFSDLYEDGINSEKYSQYMRNENYPVSFRLGTSDGYWTALFPLVGRKPTEQESRIVTDKDSQGNIIDKNVASVLNGTGDCDEVSRNKYHQFYNTASKIGYNPIDNFSDYDIVVRRFEEECISDAVSMGPSQVTLYVDGAFTDFRQYIEQYGDDIFDPTSEYYNEQLSSFINTTVPNTCEVQFPYDEDCTNSPLCCQPKNLLSDTNEFGLLEDEHIVSKNRKADSKYRKVKMTEDCHIYYMGRKRPEIDNRFYAADNEEDRVSCLESNGLYEYNGGEDWMEVGSFLFKRPASEYSYDVENYVSLSNDSREVEFNFGNLTDEDLDYLKSDFNNAASSGNVHDMSGGKISKTAIWIGVNLEDDQEYMFGLSASRKDPNSIFDMSAYRNSTEINHMTYNIYRSSDLETPVAYGRYDMITNKFTPEGQQSVDFLRLFKEDFPHDDLIYVVLDSGIILPNNQPCYEPKIYTTVAPGRCFKAYLLPVEYETIVLGFNDITVRNVKTYESYCSVPILKKSSCSTRPYEYGKLGVYESTETYPDNSELYDSSWLKITPNDLGEYREYWEEINDNNVTYRPDGTYNLEEYDLTCKNIRLFKMPNNDVSPFIEPTFTQGFSETLIYPLGLKLDKEIIDIFLDIAVKNKLITQYQRDKVTNFELWRGDRTVDKSVIMKGIVSDMYEYEENNEKILFRNFPNNTLGENALIYENAIEERLLDHPYNSTGNHRYSFLSPEVYHSKPVPPTEVTIDGYQLGTSVGRFDTVESHPKWVILGEKATKLAKTLARIEYTFDLTMFIGEQMIQVSIASSGGGFLGFSGAAAGIAGGITVGAMSAVYAMEGIFFKINEYESKWLKIFRENGAAQNFASKYSGVTEVNYLKANTKESSKLRGVVESRYIGPGRPKLVNRSKDSTDKNIVTINNVDRETSLYLDFGKDFMIDYPSFYINYDNYNQSKYSASRYISSDERCNEGDGRERRAGYPYFSLLNYVPNQYGGIDSIKWIPTNNFSQMDSEEFGTFFGGDTFISKVGFKTKVPMFITDAMKIGNRVPFDYYLFRNFNIPRFYVSYDTYVTQGTTRNAVQYASSVYRMDCPETTNSRDFYVKPPLKFYLQYYNNVEFYVESTINTNFRYGRTDPTKHFYPVGAASDFNKWTQEDFVSIRNDNTFYFNENYLLRGFPKRAYRILPSTYSKEMYDIMYRGRNGVIWSQPDVSENDLNDPWQNFKPLDKFEFPSHYGKLLALNEIESNQVMARFENQLSIFNAVDVLADRLNIQTQELGTGGIFASRPAEFSRTDFGDGGSQHFSMVSNEFGHFYTDAKRGKVYQLLPNAQGLIAISEVNQSGKSTMMQKWFNEQLPFKIKKYNIEGLTDEDIDNHYLGLGILMWWDSKFRRVFLTKLDYIPKVDNIKYDSTNGFHIEQEEEITCPDDTYTYNSFTNKCEKMVSVPFSCEEGYKYNSSTNMCEYEDCSTPNLDLAFVIDTTASQESSIEAVKDSISTIMTDIVSRFDNYRFSLVKVSDDPDGLYYTLVPFADNNYAHLMDELENIEMDNGYGWAEPYDMATLAVLNNLKTITRTGNVVEDTLSPGEFLPGSNRVIVVVTDSCPSGIDDSYSSYVEGDTIDTIVTTAQNKNVKIFTFNTYHNEIRSSGDCVRLLKDLSQGTGGQYSFTPYGEGIESSIISGLETIVCDSYYPVCVGEVIDGQCVTKYSEDPVVSKKIKKIKLQDKEYFEDISWTIAYSPIYQTWVSYYDYKPNYAIGFPNYFNTGLNYSKDSSEEGMWSHLRTNKSYQVFYGKKYPWIIDLPLKNEYTTKVLESVSYRISSYLYMNDYDITEKRNKGFNKAVIYNRSNASGMLRLNYTDNLSRPVQVDNITQEIPASHYDGEVTFNYFFNRVKNQESYAQIWKHDVNRIHQELNTEAISFKGKRILERLKGEWFNVRLIKDSDTQFKHEFKWMVSKVRHR